MSFTSRHQRVGPGTPIPHDGVGATAQAFVCRQDKRCCISSLATRSMPKRQGGQLLTYHVQSTPRYLPTPSPSTAPVRTRSSPSSSPVSSTSSAPTRSHRCANSPRATRVCRRRRVRLARRTTTRTMTTSLTSLPAITSSRLRTSLTSNKLVFCEVAGSEV